MSIRIEEINESHYESLCALITEFAAFEKHPELMTNSVEQMIAEKDYFHGFAAIDQNGAVVGYVNFFFAYYTWTGKSLYMDDLYVTRACRGQGIGTDLINRVIAYAKESGCKKLRWQVSDWNKPAIAFYKKLGASINEVDMNCDLELK